MRCFIIGNGPSLAKTNLDLIAGQPSWACNNIHLIYDKTSWRPTHYVRTEGIVDIPEKKWLPSVQLHVDMGIPVHLSEHFQGKFLNDQAENIRYHKHCHHYVLWDERIDRIDEWHLPQLCVFGSTINAVMQLAYMAGYDDQILLGCDLGYFDKRPSHFDPNYEHGNEQAAQDANLNAFWGHICVLNTIGRGKAKLRVRNATIGGDLHLYERTSLEDV